MQLIPIFNINLTEQTSTATYDPLFKPEECQEIIDKFTTEKPVVAGVHKGLKDKDKRSTLVHPIPHTEESDYLYKLLADRIGRCNLLYDFDVSGIYADLQLLEYKEGDHYGWHLDIGPGEAAHRKMSAIVQLSDPKDYEGGEVVFNAGKERELPKDQGLLAMFPSYILHKVNPITKGKRYALVAWSQGHRRFR